MNFSIEALLKSFLEGKVSEEEFCGKFEEWWNFTAEKKSYSEIVRATFENLFNVASLFTPFEEDRRRYSGYTSATELLNATKLSYSALLEERSS